MDDKFEPVAPRMVAALEASELRAEIVRLRAIISAMRQAPCESGAGIADVPGPKPRLVINCEGDREP